MSVPLVQRITPSYRSRPTSTSKHWLPIDTWTTFDLACGGAGQIRRSLDDGRRSAVSPRRCSTRAADAGDKSCGKTAITWPRDQPRGGIIELAAVLRDERTDRLVQWLLMTTGDSSYDLNMAAASLRSNSADVHMLLKALCDELSDTLGDRLVVQRGGGRLRKTSQIVSMRISIGGNQFEAMVDGSTLRCTVGHFSGGIRIRSETLEIEEWIVKLLECLTLEAAHSESARQALENIVIGGHG